MKKGKSILAFAAAMMFAVICNATVRTVSNNFPSPGQFTTIDAAIAASSTSVMDTILVAGSSNIYGAFTVNRRVCIIGTGWNPQKQNPLRSTIGIGGACVFSSSAASGSYIIGLCFTNATTSFNVTTSNVNNITFMRNNFEGKINVDQTGAGGWIIEGNSWNSLYAIGCINIGGSATIGNWIVRNNIFSPSNLYGATAIVSSVLPVTPFYILNNVFIGGGGAPAVQLGNSLMWNINNNIFKVPPGTESQMNVNSNSTTTASIGGAGTGNLVNQTVLFPFTGGTWTATADFHLSAGSPSIASGNDGTDRGVYGNLAGIYQTYGEPDIPQITLFNITSPTSISPGGTLNISVISKRHQ